MFLWSDSILFFKSTAVMIHSDVAVDFVAFVVLDQLVKFYLVSSKSFHSRVKCFRNILINTAMTHFLQER